MNRAGMKFYKAFLKKIGKEQLKKSKIQAVHITMNMLGKKQEERR